MSNNASTLIQFLAELWNKVSRKNQLPWDENWKLDEKFFQDLESWKEQHPDSTLLKVMETVNDAVTQGKDFIEFIPDAPFPARSLVKGLGYLLSLGVTIGRAKDEVFAFTTEAITWLSSVEASFGNENGGKFMGLARSNLNHIRKLINEICKWGWARLNDGRWMRIVNGPAIAEEIRVFKEKLRAGRELLANLQVNTVIVGVDEILGQIREIKKLQKSQLGAILSHLEEAKAAEERERFFPHTLSKVALSNTAYDDQGKPPCDEDTRVEILTDIKTWVDDVSEASPNFFWLTGDPGCGKSAITASIARHCKDAGTLWAQFFINRNNEVTTNPRFYFPSIARQMADHLTSDQTIKQAIYEIVKERPSVLDEMTVSQALGLFVKTVQAACDLDQTKPVVIVIDGLDETQRDKLEDTARIFSRLFKELKRRNAKVFISSRTDDEITKPFYRSLRSNERHVRHIHLDTSKPSSIEDVSRYLFRRIEELVEEWELNWAEWPGEERLKVLCVRAGGLFIWAVTVVKFFQEQLGQSKHERLNELLDVINEEGMGDVNKLYGKILEITHRAKTQAQNEWECEKFRWIVGFIAMLKEPLTIGDIAALLELRRTPTSNPVDVLHSITNLRTVLIAGSGTVTKDTIPRLHKSFVEYITSDRPEPQFRIHKAVVDGRIARNCLQLVGQLRNAGERDRLTAGSVQYAIQNWTRHLSKEGNLESGVGIIGGDGEGLRKILSANEGLRKRVMSASGDYRTHMYNPRLGFPTPLHYSAISSPCPIWAIAMSPDNRSIAAGGVDGIVRIWDSGSYELMWEAGKHHGYVTSLCFSPDSRWLVSGSSDRGVRMWDSGTGQAIGDPLEGHTSWVYSVCTDGQRIVSGSYDKTVRIWSCHTRQLIRPIKVDYIVYAVALSKDRIAAAVGSDVYVETGDRIVLMKGHSRDVLTVAFSSDGSLIASGSEDKTIRIWDAQAGKEIHRLIGHTDYVRSVAFSPDSLWIASASDDTTVRVSSSKTVKLTGHRNWVRSVAFSIDGSQIISGSDDRTIRIWAAPRKPLQITTLHLSRRPASSRADRIQLDGHPSVLSTSRSPDGFLFSASTLEGNVSIWNADRERLWETKTSCHPIHLLRISETQLVLSTLDGSTSSWNLMNGKPTHREPIIRGPQLDANSIHQLTKSATATGGVSWFPYGFNAGLWAYVDGCLIRFEGEEKSVTIFDVGELSELD